MDLDQAIQKHTEWKIKFRTAISRQESMDTDTISKDNCCELGKWLHGAGRMGFARLESFGPCVARHAAFHVEAGKVAKAVNARRYVEAEAMLENETPYGAASSAVGIAIMRLKKEARL